MKMFHGSDISIREIDLAKGKPGKDFGKGFYVTKYRHQAENMAKRVASWRKSKAVVTEFEFDEYAFDDDRYRALRFNSYSEEWFDFVMLNRKNRTPVQVHDFDLIEGPVADDDITQRIFLYLRGRLSKLEFLEELKYHGPTHQVCLCTVESLQAIEPIVEDLFTANIDDAITQALVTDYGMAEEKAIDFYFNSNTYRSLLDESTGLYQKPWTLVYQLLLKELKL